MNDSAEVYQARVSVTKVPVAKVSIAKRASGMPEAKPRCGSEIGELMWVGTERRVGERTVKQRWGSVEVEWRAR